MTDISGRERNVILPSGGQRNDGQERMSRDGTSTGIQGEEDNINEANSSDDEPAVLVAHRIIENNTSTPQNSGGTTSNNRLLAISQRGSGLPTTEEMMAAWNLIQRQKDQKQQTGPDNDRINIAGKRASNVLQSSEATPE
jgi:hypothetical protein